MLPKVDARPKVCFVSFFFCLVFFRHYATFFRKFTDSIKGYPLHFFEVFGLKKRLMSLNGLFLSFSALCNLKKIVSKKISKIILLKKIKFLQMFPIVVPLIFLSLRYGADSRRSRLVRMLHVPRQPLKNMDSTTKNFHYNRMPLSTRR